MLTFWVVWLLIYMTDSALPKTLRQRGSPWLYEQQLSSLCFVCFELQPQSQESLEVQVQFAEILFKTIRVKFHFMGRCFSIEPAGAIEDSGHFDLDRAQCWWLSLETSASSRALLGKIAAVIKMRTGAWYRCSPELITINNAKCRIEINVSCRNKDNYGWIIVLGEVFFSLEVKITSRLNMDGKVVLCWLSENKYLLLTGTVWTITCVWLKSYGLVWFVEPELVPATHFIVILFWKMTFDIQVWLKNQWVNEILELSTSIKNIHSIFFSLCGITDTMIVLTG